MGKRSITENVLIEITKALRGAGGDWHLEFQEIESEDAPEPKFICRAYIGEDREPRTVYGVRSYSPREFTSYGATVFAKKLGAKLFVTNLLNS